MRLYRSRSVRTQALLCLVGFAAVGVSADAVEAQRRSRYGPKSQEELIEARAKKLAKPVFGIASWSKSLDEAKTLSAGKEQLIFAYFTRSYAP